MARRQHLKIKMKDKSILIPCVDNNENRLPQYDVSTPIMQ